MRRYRTVIILVLLVVLPLTAAVVGARFLMPGNAAKPQAKEVAVVAPPPPEEPETRRVLAAARGLPVGALLREEDLSEVELAAGEVRRGHVAADGPNPADALRGHALREAVAAGAPLTRSAVVGPGQRGFLAAVLKPGTRAVTIRLGAGTRHAGLIDPGDRVDVILTAKLRLSDGGQSVFTRTILEDVRVVAVDRRVGGATASKSGEPVKRREIATATLEVSPPQADRLALGEHEGKLSLAVRSLAVAAARQTAGKAVDMEELLSLPQAKEVAVVAPPPPEEPETRRVLAAARGLPVGALLREEDLSEVELAAGEVRRGHVAADGPNPADALRGHALREAVAAGAPLTRSAVVGPGQRGFLAAVLKPGTRAVTIRLGAGARHAGLIDPGDRVDVILTAKLRLAGGGQSVFTRTILEDVRVVAVDRRVGGATASKSGEPVKRSEIATATLEVLPAQADRLALGEHEGKLSLAVRSLAAAAATQTASKAVVDLKQLMSLPALKEIVTPKSDTGPAVTEEPVLAPLAKVRIIRGSKLTEQIFSGPAGVRIVPAVQPQKRGGPDGNPSRPATIPNAIAR